MLVHQVFIEYKIKMHIKEAWIMIKRLHVVECLISSRDRVEYSRVLAPRSSLLMYHFVTHSVTYQKTPTSSAQINTAPATVSLIPSDRIEGKYIRMPFFHSSPFDSLSIRESHPWSVILCPGPTNFKCRQGFYSSCYITNSERCFTSSGSESLVEFFSWEGRDYLSLT